MRSSSRFGLVNRRTAAELAARRRDGDLHVWRTKLTPSMLLHAYANGIFPMADSRDGGDIRWYAPNPRGIIEFQTFEMGRHFRKLMRSHPFQIRINGDFRATMQACAEPRLSERETWISQPFIDTYTALHDLGFAHSVEAWLDSKLVGGLYLVQVGAAVMGESMFSRVTDASKVCLLFLIERLKTHGFSLLDTQFITPHLTRFGAVEISRRDYEARLRAALAVEPAPSFVTPPTEFPPPAPHIRRPPKPL